MKFDTYNTSNMGTGSSSPNVSLCFHWISFIFAQSDLHMWVSLTWSFGGFVEGQGWSFNSDKGLPLNAAVWQCLMMVTAPPSGSGKCHVLHFEVQFQGGVVKTILKLVRKALKCWCQRLWPCCRGEFPCFTMKHKVAVTNDLICRFNQNPPCTDDLPTVSDC